MRNNDLVVVIVGLALCAVWPAPLQSQAVATIRMVDDSIAADAEFCDLHSVRKPDPKDSKDPVKDSLIFEFYEDTTWQKPVQPKASLISLVDWQSPHPISKKNTKDTVGLEPLGLSGRTVVVRRDGLDKPLCVVVPKPTPQPATRTALRTTQFIADGAVSAALRSGNGEQAATGSLGIDHQDIKAPDEKQRYIIRIPYLRSKGNGKNASVGLAWKHLFPLSAERLRALITVATTADTLVGSNQTDFRQALLAPALVGHGRSGSGSIDYQAATGLLSGEHGPHLNFTFSKGTWRFKNTNQILADLPATDSISAGLTLVSVDTRWRWTPIRQARDPKGNDFAFSIEAGWTWRMIGGDALDKPRFLEATVGSGRTKFSGPAAAFVISLRQVTATADLPFLRKKGERLEGLTGMQPIVTINFSAPIFTF